MGQGPDSHPNRSDGGSDKADLIPTPIKGHFDERAPWSWKVPEVEVVMDLNVADALVECVLELKGGVHCGDAGSGIPGHTQRR